MINNSEKYVIKKASPILLKNAALKNQVLKCKNFIKKILCTSRCKMYLRPIENKQTQFQTRNFYH